ncbi:hypothetical protein TOPH_01928 [Tolypocladium ophioglossoides CBS 100239]|uniref:Uncharacterized protein n=1 Tax=Tolypocladium ophioglossoides (strain CBS 100239) TaxID=1163406 RepID=A0A0L0NIG1_TOLOC|nr:hypothetical protein TOPH_01928 [Tolypocladium ophioglossoides CBS 100239]
MPRIIAIAIPIPNAVPPRQPAAPLLHHRARLGVKVAAQALPRPLGPQVLGAGARHAVDARQLADDPLGQRPGAALQAFGVAAAASDDYGVAPRALDGELHWPTVADELAGPEVELRRQRLFALHAVLCVLVLWGIPVAILLLLGTGLAQGRISRLHLLNPPPPLPPPRPLLFTHQRHLHLKRRHHRPPVPGILLDQTALPAPHHHPALDLGKVGQLGRVELAHHHRVALLARARDPLPQQVDRRQVVGHGECVDEDADDAGRGERQHAREPAAQQARCPQRRVVEGWGGGRRRGEDAEGGEARLEGEEQRGRRVGDVEERVRLEQFLFPLGAGYPPVRYDARGISYHLRGHHVFVPQRIQLLDQAVHVVLVRQVRHDNDPGLLVAKLRRELANHRRVMQLVRRVDVYHGQAARRAQARPPVVHYHVRIGVFGRDLVDAARAVARVRQDMDPRRDVPGRQLAAQRLDYPRRVDKHVVGELQRNRLPPAPADLGRRARNLVRRLERIVGERRRGHRGGGHLEDVVIGRRQHRRRGEVGHGARGRWLAAARGAWGDLRPLQYQDADRRPS